MSAIAKHAGVGAGTIYRYYESKEDLINALYLREKQAAATRALEGYRPVMRTLDAVRLIWKNILAAQVENPSRSRFLEQYYNSPFIGDETKRSRERIMGGFVQIVERGIERGELRPLKPMALLIMFLSPVLSLANAQAAGDLDSSDELFEELFETVWRGIGNG